MVQLIIDYSTNRVLGYNMAIPELTTDLVLVDDEEIENFRNIDSSSALYYENGQLVKKELDPLNKKIQEINDEEFNIRVNVENEQKIFMDNILSGKTMEEASAIARLNREKLENIRNLRKDIYQKIEERKAENIVNLFKEEEKLMTNKYFLSIITCVRDENDYIEEWITYHVEKMNVEHFYIYDNESTLPLRDYLESVNYKYLDKLTIIEWETTEHTQQDTCNHWLANYKAETKWFICMDVDEFIKIKDNSKTLTEYLYDNSQFSSIKCKWKHYTANGHVKKTFEPVMERFTVETDWNDHKDGGKYFAQSNRISSFVSYVPQSRLYTRGLEQGSIHTVDFFQLNHYFTKSYDEWMTKINRGSVNPNYMRKYQEFFEINPDMDYLNTGEIYEQGYGSAQN